MAKTVKKWIVQTVLQDGQSFTADEAALCDVLKRWGQIGLEFYACGRSVKLEVIPEEVYIENEVGPKMADAWQAGREHERQGGYADVCTRTCDSADVNGGKSPRLMPPGIGPGWVPCPDCHGDGVTLTPTVYGGFSVEKCERCKGTSWVRHDLATDPTPIDAEHFGGTD